MGMKSKSRKSPKQTKKQGPPCQASSHFCCAMVLKIFPSVAQKQNLTTWRLNTTSNRKSQLTNFIQLLILGLVKESMEEEVGGVLALVQGAHPPITHANTSWTDFQINFLEHFDLEIWVTKVDARPVGRLVFLLVLLVDLEPQAWNISEGTL